MRTPLLRWWPAFVLCCAVPFCVPATAARPAPPAPAAAAESTRHTIAFEHAGGVSGAVMVIRAEVNGVDTRLLLDTGAAFPLVIDREVAKQRGLEGYYGVPVHGVGESRIHMTAVESLAIGKWRHDGALTAGIMNISHIRTAMSMLGTRIDGILGMPVISGFRSMKLDFPRRRVEWVEFAADDELPAELTAVRAEFARDLKAVEAIRAGTAGGLGVKVAVGGTGLRITEVWTGSVAAAAGLQAGDRLTEIGETPLGQSPRDLRIREALTGAGQAVTIQYTRNGEARSARVTLGAWRTGKPAGASEAEDF